jgi:hypothetical protein
MNSPLAALVWASLATCLIAGCKDAEDGACTGCDAAPAATAGTQVRMSFGAGFYASPFPSDERLLGDGRPDMTGFPNPDPQALVTKVLTLLTRDTHGFGLTSGIFFSLTGPLHAGALPDLAGSIRPESRVFLVGIDPMSPDLGQRYPVEVGFREDGGPYGAPHQLALLPLQGIPLRPRAAYAAVVLRSLGDEAGAPLGVSLEMAQLAAGKRPDHLSESGFSTYQKALGALRGMGVDPSQIAGLAAFTTGDPTAGMTAVRADMLSRPPPAPTAPFLPAEVFDEFCVFRTTIAMPTYQTGMPPFADEGGQWALDAQGKATPQSEEMANFVVTVPRRPMPAGGYPIVLFSRTGGGGDRPLVDRGVQPATGQPALVPGTGPGLTFARAGFAGASIDGPHGGLRNITHDDEQFLMFNVGNPGALRDNVRQSAAELALAAHVLAQVSIDASSCPGTSPGPVTFDAGTMALMGHSMGATISPLTLASEPLFRAAILSGAGGSWIENILYKQEPIPVKGIAEILLGLNHTDYKLHSLDPMLSLFQWAVEPADPPAYGRGVIAEPAAGSPRHVLMLQGIVDHYILPSIASATSLSFGLDQAGDPLDSATPEIASFTPLAQLLPFTGRALITYPVRGNVTGAQGSATTAAVVQHRSDGIEDGHEIAFQTPAPKHQYRCFLEGLARNAPVIVAPAAEDAPCP